MLWVEHAFVSMIIARWLWRVASWFAAAHAEDKHCAELMLEARLNAEIINTQLNVERIKGWLGPVTSVKSVHCLENCRMRCSLDWN